MVKFYDIILQKITCYRLSACRGLAARVCVCGGWAGGGIAYANKHIGLHIKGI